jgi:hypothetical protein
MFFVILLLLQAAFVGNLGALRRIHTSHAVPLPYHEYAFLKSTSEGHGRFAAGERHGMCELESAVQRRHVDDLPAFGTIGEWQGSGRVAGCA